MFALRALVSPHGQTLQIMDKGTSALESLMEILPFRLFPGRRGGEGGVGAGGGYERIAWKGECRLVGKEWHCMTRPHAEGRHGFPYDIPGGPNWVRQLPARDLTRVRLGSPVRRGARLRRLHHSRQACDRGHRRRHDRVLQPSHVCAHQVANQVLAGDGVVGNHLQGPGGGVAAGLCPPAHT